MRDVVFGRGANRSVRIPGIRLGESSFWKGMRIIAARMLLGLGVLHCGHAMTVTTCREDYHLVLLKERLVALNCMDKCSVLLRKLKRILCFEVTVQGIIEVLHVCHDVER